MFGFWDWNLHWNGHWSWAWGWFLVGGALVGFAIMLVIEVLFLLNLRDVLNRVEPRHRAMPPNHVWLNLIPVFGLGWFIYTVIKVTESLRAEFHGRGWAPAGDFAYAIGLTAGILGVVSALGGGLPLGIGFLGGLAGLAHLVLWIIYWVRMAGIKGRMGPVAGWGGPAYPPPSGQGPVGRYEPPARDVPRWSGPPADQGVPGPGTAGENRKTEGHARQCAMCGTAVAPEDQFCRTCGLRMP